MDNPESSLELKKRAARREGKGAIVDAHKRCADHRAEVEASDVAGCFYCCATFPPSRIVDWVDDGNCALCPECGIDSILGSASGFPVGDPGFLKEMNRFWFQ